MIRLVTLFASLIVSQSFALDRPNLLLLISDDQSYPHASAYGSKMVSTPTFDRIANEGVLFTNAFCPAPGCSPSRAALLTGLQIWQIEHAGTHGSSFHQKYRSFMDLLQEAGYHTGHTGKGWGPGNFKVGGRKQNPAGPSYGSKKGNYAAGFEKFLKARPDNIPFAFWFGSSDPHRSFEKGSGQRAGKELAQAEVPTFLPDFPAIRDDLLDYAFEVERFDQDCGKMLKILERTNQLEDTLIIITSDNGMAFPYAKANCTEYGIHMPLAICWKSEIPGKRRNDKLISFVDLTATIHEATSIKAPSSFPLAGKSFLNGLRNTGELELQRSAIFAGRERHSSSRYNTLGYPQRCIRTEQFLYIRNYKPERWPAGPGRKFTRKPGSPLGPEHGGYHDIDACPTLDFMIANRANTEIGRFFHLAVDKRPAEQLFNIKVDPGCLHNLASDSIHSEIRANLAQQLDQYLKKTNDPRATGKGDIFESYPRYSSIRWFPKPDWAQLEPESVPEMPWLKSKL